MVCGGACAAVRAVVHVRATRFVVCLGSTAAKVVVCEAKYVHRFVELRKECPALEVVIQMDPSPIDTHRQVGPIIYIKYILLFIIYF
jgi:hypothetical protein